jgi:hypothetical protein
VQAEVEVAITGALLQSIYFRLEPLNNMGTAEEAASWWKHFASSVRNAVAPPPAAANGITTKEGA